ncbi:MAG: alpha/beta hydrolase [Anaerolineae bacterium]|nr:alpha/beta hydrolase [Anaerolineae bacterium]
MEYYRDQLQWQLIQKYLPENYRLKQDEQPRESFYAWRDCYIHLDNYQPPQPKASGVMLHGVGGNGRLLSFMALPLMRNGYRVLCPDLPLYGNSIVKGRIVYQDWVDCTLDLIKRYEDNGPLFLLGLSAGGMLAYQVAAACKTVKGLMLTCLLDQRIPLVGERTAIHPAAAKAGRVLLNPAARLFPQVKLPMKWLVNMNAIANNPALVKSLLYDKRASGARVPLEFVASLLTPTIPVEPQDFFNCPVLLMHPRQDRWTALELSRLFFDALACPRELLFLENAGHFPIEEPGIRQMEEFCLNFIAGILKPPTALT